MTTMQIPMPTGETGKTSESGDIQNPERRKTPPFEANSGHISEKSEPLITGQIFGSHLQEAFNLTRAWLREKHQ